MNFKHSEFHEKFMIDTFLINLIQFEKTGSIGKAFIPLENLKTKIYFRSRFL